MSIKYILGDPCPKCRFRKKYAKTGRCIKCQNEAVKLNKEKISKIPRKSEREVMAGVCYD